MNKSKFLLLEQMQNVERLKRTQERVRNIINPSDWLKAIDTTFLSQHPSDDNTAKLTQWWKISYDGNEWSNTGNEANFTDILNYAKNNEFYHVALFNSDGITDEQYRYSPIYNCWVVES